MPDKLLSLQLDVMGIHGLTDADAADLGQALPKFLVNLTLVFTGCCLLGDAGVAAFAQSLPPSTLRTLNLSLVGCELITDSGLIALAMQLSPDLEALTLDLRVCEKITDSGAAALAHYLPAALQTLSLNFNSTSVSDERLASCQSLEAMKTWQTTATVEVAPAAPAAPKFPEKDIAEIKKAFAKADRNKNGVLSKRELKAVLVALKLSEQDVDELISEADVDGDGCLNLDEFIDWIFGGGGNKSKPKLAKSKSRVSDVKSRHRLPRP
ncbi:unnamed protein product [Polarella glacialis]|uniref:EF-hand domain-containing protein n=1 Tax=Polarella glacialis TaxID=89957 RepID=A0A813JX80_POLGL|nr:unnamed protein product [Polarella glacialis]